MIEITHRETGITLTYPISRALNVYGVDTIAEALAGVHLDYTARQINGRGQPIEQPSDGELRVEHEK